MNKFKEIVHKLFATWLWLIIPLIALDQATKMAAHLMNGILPLFQTSYI
ncbi:MAG: hypothetical protein WCY90_00700 [Bacilli bacterium]